MCKTLGLAGTAAAGAPTNAMQRRAKEAAAHPAAEDHRASRESGHAVTQQQKPAAPAEAAISHAEPVAPAAGQEAAPASHKSTGPGAMWTAASVADKTTGSTATRTATHLLVMTCNPTPIQMLTSFHVTTSPQQQRLAPSLKAPSLHSQRALNYLHRYQVPAQVRTHACNGGEMTP